MTLPSLADVLTAALDDMFKCGPDGYPHYCPNCDTQLFYEDIIKALLPSLQAREQTLREELETAREERDELGRALSDLFNDTPDASGRYPHLAICNGDFRLPVAHDDRSSICNCRQAPIFVRIRAAAEARVSSLTAEREALKLDRDALMDRVSDMIDEREALQEALAKAKRTKP